MAIHVERVRVKSILTRSSGYLTTVTSHSLQPYRGCSFGRALCGSYCYVQHNPYVTKGRSWGTFLEVRENAAAMYRASAARERRWAARREEAFSIFMSSSTDPFLPQEKSAGITRSVLEAMVEQPPDLLIVQTRSPLVVDALDVLSSLSQQCSVRIHMTIESDREGLPGLPSPASTIDQRFTAVARAREAGLDTVVTVSPLCPLSDPVAFLQRIEQCASAVVFDHFIGGDGSADGSRTRRTQFPAAMEALDPASLKLDYCKNIVSLARDIMPKRVGFGIRGFAGVYH